MSIKFTSLGLVGSSGLGLSGDQLHLQINSKVLTTLRVERETTLHVMAQRIWLTHSGSCADYHLHAGDAVVLQPGLVLIDTVAAGGAAASVLLQVQQERTATNPLRSLQAVWARVAAAWVGKRHGAAQAVSGLGGLQLL